MFIVRYKEDHTFSAISGKLFLANGEEFSDLLLNTRSITYYIGTSRGWMTDSSLNIEEQCDVAYPVEYVT